jgi:hypothetical protein
MLSDVDVRHLRWTRCRNEPHHRRRRGGHRPRQSQLGWYGRHSGRQRSESGGTRYVSAFAPDVGESGSSLIGAHPTPPGLSTIITDTAGFVYQTVDGVLKNIAPDIPEMEARVLAATQGRLAGKAFGQTVTAAAWKMKPSWYIVTADDRVVSTQLQAAVAKRMAAGTTVRNRERT